MKRVLGILVGAVVLAALGVLTFREDFYSQYHYDTLREERFTVTKIFGIPIWKKERAPHDEFSASYTKITGKTPDPTRWRKMPPDYTRGLVGGMYRCYGTPFPLRERNEMLEALFRRYEDGLPSARANEIFARIDNVIPAVGMRDSELNLEAVDEIRAELGLERRYTTTTNKGRQATPSPAP